MSFNWRLKARRDGHVGDHAFSDVIALGARQPTQQTQHQKSAGDDHESCQPQMAQVLGREIKELSHAPHGPAGNLGGNHGPDRHVKPALFRTLVARRAAGAGREVERGGNHNRKGKWIVKLEVKIVDDPASGEKVNSQSDQVDGERHQQVDPRRGIADDAIPEIGLRFAIMRDVRARLAAGKPAGISAPRADGCYDGEPDPMAAVRAVSVEIGRKMAGQDPENPYPDGYVQHAVIILVSFTLNNFFHECLELHFNWLMQEMEETGVISCGSSQTVIIFGPLASECWRKSRMKYYLYISDSKIEMLYNQIATSTENSREASIGFDLKVLKGEIKQGRGVPENSVTRLNEVVKALRDSDAVGSIDAPKKYIGGNLRMTWSTYGGIGDESPITFWSYSAPGIAMALAGSKYNLLGEQRPGTAHSHSLTPPMVQWFLDNLQDPVPETTKGLAEWDEGELDEYDIANGTWLAATQTKGIKESTEFVARVLHDSKWPQGFRGSDAKRILLASPLYVASVD